MQLYKKYVDVVVMQRKTGELRPLYLCWNDGREYKIDKVLSHSRKESCVGGLFLEKDRWFLESYQP